MSTASMIAAQSTGISLTAGDPHADAGLRPDPTDDQDHQPDFDPARRPWRTADLGLRPCQQAAFERGFGP